MSSAASATTGSRAIKGVRNTRNRISVTAATRLASWVLPPAESLMVVRDWLPVTEKPWNRPVNTSATPSAVSSWLGLTS